MLDIKRIVEDKEVVKKALLKRMEEKDFNLDEITDAYDERKEKQQEYDNLRAKQKGFNDQMSKVEKGSDEFKKLIVELKNLSEEVKEAEEELREAEEELKKKLEVLPNLPDDDVVGGGKENNRVIREIGEKPEFGFKIKDHLEIGEGLGMIDMDRATKMAGSNFAMYTGLGAQLEWAMINYFISEHIKDGYKMILPPHLLVEESGYTAGQLPKFKDDVYWVQDGSMLLPTAETALANIYRNELLNEADLPIKLFGYTPCYRREAGGYRANERGLLRMHQFNKVEMFQYTTPEQSEAALEELLNKATNLVDGLGLHYRVSQLAAADCSAGAAKTYDVEVWLPYLQTYYEVSSISNVRDYQARRGNIKYKTGEGDNKYVHMLNASGLATSRLMVAVLETYQNEDGSLTVPKALQQFVGKEKIEKGK
ncbi:MAG: Serine-tRNA ligase [candidate division WS6 bacterium GW2011_GWF2_39_15]|uniref:Serine--tRNA ligase n=1 Tax=candidate division WS6 bacterium GW2011_GWF2_39_15 TaxID=1619100 RepID=A0A0G0MNS7_9BACT|nr:MAG: Serine-tRNA ligase [candidate division WS6 bacterium GW2011_GWF2_39_15]